MMASASWFARLGFLVFVGALPRLAAQGAAPAKEYRNPVLFADYSDPDVIRDGDDFYLVASTFQYVPGLPVLHSRDLVHWEISGHVVTRLTMDPAYDMSGPMRYGRGVWAPAVRFHAGLFYVYFPTPDEGIFVSTAPHMTGPWTVPEVVLAGPGYEDPCPFWDEDGTAWLVHSKKGAGPLILHRMSADGKHLLDAGRTIVEDPVHLKTLEGPKLYKRHGWYYIFAPMGGVGTGAQAVLRARTIDGPYEWRIVLKQGETDVNGPHQGAWVEGVDGRSWFIHFQQRGAHGRIVWLEPMVWRSDDWPEIGQPIPGAAAESAQEPVASFSVPREVLPSEEYRIKTSDGFAVRTGGKLNELWEWNHNPDDQRWSLTERPGFLRLHPDRAADLLHARNTLTQVMQDRSLQVTVSLDASRLAPNDQAGLSAFERGLSGIGVLRNAAGERFLFYTQAGRMQLGRALGLAASRRVQLRAKVVDDIATYSFSVDRGRTFEGLGSPAPLVFSWWKGARPAMFAFNTEDVSSGFADFSAFRYEALR